MRFWHLLASLLWRSSADRDRTRTGPGIRNMESLHEANHLETRSVRSTYWTYVDQSDEPRVAEVVQVSIGQQHRLTGARSQFVRLSVAIVDYLLEHDWYSLLAGQRRGSPAARRARRAGRAGTTSAESADLLDESHRTMCMTDTSWSIVALNNTNAPSDSTSSTDE